MESRQKRSEPTHRPRGTGRGGGDAVIVEEEPAHELYANLCGIVPSSHSYSAAGSLTPAPRQGEGGDCSPHSGVSVVPVDGDAAERAKDDDDDDCGDRGDVFSTGRASSSATGGPSRSDPKSAPAAPGSVAEHLRMALSNPNPSSALSDLTLNETNCHKGFEMLTKMGWRESDGGLGRRRQGGMIPVRTRLPNPKRPRAGLGVRGGLGRARVTHKVANVEGCSAGEGGGGDDRTTTRTERRKLARSEAERERRRDRRIRMMLRTDVSSEYEDLYLKLHRSNR